MSKQLTKNDVSEEPEDKSGGTTAKMLWRFKMALLLLTLVAFTWLCIELFLKGELPQTPFEQVVSKISQPEESPAVDEVVVDEPVVETQIGEVLPVQSQVEGQIDEQMIQLEPMEPEPGAAEVEPPYPLPLLPPAPPPPPPVPEHMQRELPVSVISIEPAESEKQLRMQGRLIQLLKCQVDLSRSKQDGAALKEVLKQCYAVLVNAGVTPSDHKTLSGVNEQSGVLDIKAMHAMFKQAAVDALRMTHKESGVANTWLDDLIMMSKSLFTVRKTGWQDGGDLEAIIGRAEHYLLNKEFEKSMVELEALPPSAVDVFRPYSGAIQQYLAYTHIMEALAKSVTILEEGDAR